MRNDKGCAELCRAAPPEPGPGPGAIRAGAARDDACPFLSQQKCRLYYTIVLRIIRLMRHNTTLTLNAMRIPLRMCDTDSYHFTRKCITHRLRFYSVPTANGNCSASWLLTLLGVAVYLLTKASWGEARSQLLTGVFWYFVIVFILPTLLLAFLFSDAFACRLGASGI